MNNTLINLFSLLAGYHLGRLGHVLNYFYTNDWKFLPHHWITGMILLYGSFISKKEWLFFFSVGFIISDFNDMINFRLFEADNVDKLRFYGFD